MYRVAWGTVNLFSSGCAEFFSPALCGSDCRLSQEGGSPRRAPALRGVAGRFAGDSQRIHPKGPSASEMTNPPAEPQIPSVQELRDCPRCPAEPCRCRRGRLQEAAVERGMLRGASCTKPTLFKKAGALPAPEAADPAPRKPASFCW